MKKSKGRNCNQCIAEKLKIRIQKYELIKKQKELNYFQLSVY